MLAKRASFDMLMLINHADDKVWIINRNTRRDYGNARVMQMMHPYTLQFSYNSLFYIISKITIPLEL